MDIILIHTIIHGFPDLRPMIQQQVSLLPHNTFGIAATAEHFMEAHSVADLRAALRSGIRPLLVLGGGSNMLFVRDTLPGLVLKNSLRGIEVVRTFNHKVWVKVQGGEVWHEFVLWAVQQGYGGLENMSLIPGSVGAAPVQNIGAYGTELKDVMVRLEAMDMTGKIHVFNRKKCRFGYRDSIFKQEAKGKYIITAVTFSLSRHKHNIHIAYGDIKKTLQEMGAAQPTIADVSRAVIHIRSSKLPDPTQIGNCGSFFKNPEVEAPVFQRILAAYPQAPNYPLPDGKVKVPAGWLIEQCGWKGKRVGNTGSYEKQALVLVNYGGAKGAEVRDLAYAIIDSVDQKFGIRLEPEVNMIQ